MSRLYLVRRGLETLLGPMTSSELRAAYKRMDFGLQDEVAGHCGRWVQFEDIDKIKRFYPELGSLVKDTMLGGWGLSENAGKNLTRTQRHRRVRKRRNTITFGFAFLGLVAVIAAVGIFLAKTNNLPSKFLDPSDPNPDRAAAILTKSGKVGLIQYVENFQSEILNEVKQSKKSYESWLPFLRLAAFNQDGEMPGMKSTWLRGVERVAAPSDCSMKRWKRRFAEVRPDWFQTTQSKDIPQKYWLRILLWDPHWIIRRTQQADWIDPSSYYEACLRMADKALSEMIEFPEKGVDTAPLKPIQTRLDFVLGIVQGLDMQNLLAIDDNLFPLSCMEAATTMEQVNACTSGLSPANPWFNYFQLRLALNRLRIAATDTAMTAQDVSQNLSGLPESLPALDPHTSFDYRPEQKLLRLILLNRGNVADALERFSVEFRNVSFGAD